jgi:hypothetical protein
VRVTVHADATRITARPTQIATAISNEIGSALTIAARCAVNNNRVTEGGSSTPVLDADGVAGKGTIGDSGGTVVRDCSRITRKGAISDVENAIISDASIVERA